MLPSLRICSLFLAFLPLCTLQVAVAQVHPPQFKDPSNLGPDFPTPLEVVDEMLRAAQIKPGETIYDLGCGDGRILIRAVEKYHAVGVGVEMSEDISEKTSEHIKALGLQDKIQIIHGNALRADLSSADVVALYLTTDSNNRLKPQFGKMHPGARIVSHDYKIPGWKPSKVSKVKILGNEHTVYVYVVAPAA